jgi:hypothetical protein
MFYQSLRLFPISERMGEEAECALLASGASVPQQGSVRSIRIIADAAPDRQL